MSIVLDVPAAPSLDLADACTLVYAAPMQCEAFGGSSGSGAGRFPRDEQAIRPHVGANASVQVDGPDPRDNDGERP